MNRYVSKASLTRLFRHQYTTRTRNLLGWIRDRAALLAFFFLALFVVAVVAEACENRLQAFSFLPVCEPRCAYTNEFVAEFAHMKLGFIKDVVVGYPSVEIQSYFVLIKPFQFFSRYMASQRGRSLWADNWDPIVSRSTSIGRIWKSKVLWKKSGSSQGIYMSLDVYRGRSPRIVHRKVEPSILLSCIGCGGLHFWDRVDDYKSALDFDQIISGNTIAISHRFKLAGINASDAESDHNKNYFAYERPYSKWSVPPRRLIRIAVGISMFGWGRWVTAYTRRRISERTAILGIICVIGGVILALWSI
jgi:hypothetical protein